MDITYTLKALLFVFVAAYTVEPSFASTPKAPVLSAGSFVYYGDVPEHFVRDIEKITRVLNRVRQIVDPGKQIDTPQTLRVYFVPFTKAARTAYPKLARYQKEVLHLHGGSKPYYESFTEGVSYAEVSNAVQLNPVIFYGKYYKLPYGKGKAALIGHGVMRFIHEYIHVLYTRLGIPSRFHHCTMIAPDEDELSLNQKAGTLLDEAGLASRTEYLKMVTSATRVRCLDFSQFGAGS